PYSRAVVPAPHVGPPDTSTDPTEGSGVEQRPRRSAILRPHGFISEHRERVAPEFANDAVIVHDQNARRLHGRPVAMNPMTRPSRMRPERTMTTSPTVRQPMHFSPGGWK